MNEINTKQYPYQGSGTLDEPQYVPVTEEVEDQLTALTAIGAKHEGVAAAINASFKDMTDNVGAIATGNMSEELLSKHLAHDAKRLEPPKPKEVPNPDRVAEAASDKAWEKHGKAAKDVVGPDPQAEKRLYEQAKPVSIW